MDKTIVDKYFKLTKELSGIKLSNYPIWILPASKEQIEADLEEKIEKSNNENIKMLLVKLKDALSCFIDTSPEKFIGKVTSTPSLFITFYTIYIVFIDNGSKLWLLLPIVFFLIVGINFTFLLNERRVTEAHLLPKTLFFYLFKNIFSLITFISYTTIWIKMILINGLYNLYLSVFVNFSISHLLLSLGNLIVGYYYSKVVNILHYFLFINHYGSKSLRRGLEA